LILPEPCPAPGKAWAEILEILFNYLTTKAQRHKDWFNFLGHAGLIEQIMNRRYLKKQIEPIPPEVNRIAREIVDAAYCVHSNLGPGLLESVYENCLAYELNKRGLRISQQLSLPIIYDGNQLDSGLRLDFLVEECVIVELKAVERLLPVHHAQVLTYLKLTGYRLGLLINFNVSIIRNGIKRIAL
jgi:GxxExxY protein